MKPAKKRQLKRIKKGKRRGTPTPGLLEIKIQDIDSAVMTYESILQDFKAGKIKADKFRALCYGFQILCGLIRIKYENEWSAKLDAIEERIKEAKGFKVI